MVVGEVNLFFDVESHTDYGADGLSAAIKSGVNLLDAKSADRIAKSDVDADTSGIVAIDELAADFC